jgi:hypothetical protein
LRSGVTNLSAFFTEDHLAFRHKIIFKVFAVLESAQQAKIGNEKIEKGTKETTTTTRTRKNTYVGIPISFKMRPKTLKNVKRQKTAMMIGK